MLWIHLIIHGTNFFYLNSVVMFRNLLSWSKHTTKSFVKIMNRDFGAGCLGFIETIIPIKKYYMIYFILVL